MNVCWLGSLYIISPMARISRNMIRPTPMYTKMMLGPVSAIDLPEPRNRPVPMVPPMAMNWTWRFFRPRSISLLWSRLSTDLMCAALEPAELVFSEVIMFTTLPREPHIAPAEALFLGTYADFAALAHPVCGQPCPSDHLIPVFSPRHTPLPPYLAYIWQIHEVDRYFLAYIWHLLTAKHHLGGTFWAYFRRLTAIYKRNGS